MPKFLGKIQCKTSICARFYITNHWSYFKSIYGCKFVGTSMTKYIAATSLAPARLNHRIYLNKRRTYYPKYYI